MRILFGNGRGDGGILFFGLGEEGEGWGGTYGEGEEAETEEDAGVTDEGEDVHLVNCAGRRPWMGWRMGVG